MNRPLAFAVIALSASLASAAEPASLVLGDPDHPVLEYQVRYHESPKPDAPWYGRSGFIHPVRTPSGRIVTDDFPSDHLHQHGLMFAWTSARIDGRKVDFWNSHQRQGRVEHAEIIEATANRIVVKLRHVDLTGDKPRVVLHETWRITRVPHEEMNVFDLESVQTCASDTPIEIAEYHYGAMCVRGAAGWIERGCTMLTSDGKNAETGNHTRPHWVAMFGEADGATCGIAAMAHPTNHATPQPVRLHPKMPYFCYAPMVAGAFKIEPGTPYVSRFRFVAFDGKPDPAALGALRADFAESKE